MKESLEAELMDEEDMGKIPWRAGIVDTGTVSPGYSLVGAATQCIIW